MPKLLHPSRLKEASLTGLVTDMALKAGAETFKRQQAAIMGRIDSRPSLPAITCPTLVLCGREDVITPVEVHEEMVAAVRGARLVVIEQCGHLSTLDQPKQVNAALQTWLLDVAQ
jgi:pimeloyl-ACP methyl ester carboxylesterase